MQVNILDAKNQLSQLIKVAQAGQSVVIANRGQPVAKLVAVQAWELARGVADAPGWLAAHPLPPHARRTDQEIDADLARERDAWD